MKTDAVVQFRTSAETKRHVQEACESAGLTLSAFLRIVFARTEKDRRLPFDLMVLNADSAAAKADVESGNVKTFDGVKSLMADLRAPD